MDADSLLLATTLLPRQDTRRQRLAGRLAGLLQDYGGSRIPSSQRLFLMNELERLGLATFPTLRAERLAAQFLESDQPRIGGAGLQPTNVPDVWKFASSDGRLIALYRTSSIAALTRSVIDSESASGVTFDATPPGRAPGDISTASGAMLPGWQLSFSLIDTARLDSESSRRRNLYLGAGYVAIAGIVFVFLIAGRSFRKQLRLARLKTDMVAAVSHELKTPLASMGLLLDNLLEDDNAYDAKTREYLRMIASENERLSRRIENFLAFARIEKRRLTFAFRETRPEDILGLAVAAVEERFHQIGAAIQVSIDPSLPALRGDSNALATALINLLDNAYKYTPAEKHVAVRVYREGERVVFAVIDNGVGIPRKEQKRIFRSFYQSNQSLSRDTGGCGLGLSIVDYIVVAHGGSIAVASAPGEGSTFSIALPALHAT
jgi:signal transduction histidine kinase